MEENTIFYVGPETEVSDAIETFEIVVTLSVEMEGDAPISSEYEAMQTVGDPDAYFEYEPITSSYEFFLEIGNPDAYFEEFGEDIYDEDEYFDDEDYDEYFDDYYEEEYYEEEELEFEEVFAE